MRTNKKWIAMLMSLIAVLVLSVLGACTTFEDSSEQGKKLDSIELGTDDVQKEYTVGDELSTEGLLVTAHYSDETTAAVTEFTATANGLDENGKLTVESDTVTVSYTEGDVTETATYAITVTEAQPAQKTLTSIEVNAENAKKEYTVGDVLSTEGLVVTAHYSDETTAAVTEFTATANGLDENGKLTVESDTVTVSYTEGDVTETATYTITVTAPQPVPTWALVKSGLKESEGKVYIGYTGTYANMTDAEIKAAVEGSLIIDVIYPTGDPWKGSIDQEGYTTEFTSADGAWEFMTEITAGSLNDFYVPYVYYLDKTNAAPYVGTWTIGETVESGNYKYELVNGAGYWGNITFTITDMTVPAFNANGASVEADGDKAYFVISGSYVNYEEEALKSELTNAYFNLQQRGDPWTEYTDFERTVNVNTEDKTWQIKFDVTSLPVHGNPYTSHFLMDGATKKDLKLSAEQAIHESSIEVGDKTYTLINYKEFTSTQENNWGEPYNWGVVSLKVTGALMYTGATIESGEDAIYLVLSAENNKYSEEELQSITIYDGDKVINISKVVTEADKNVKLYFDVKELDVKADGGDFWFFTHWTINGIEKVDVKCPVTEGAVQTDEKVYRLTTEYGMPVIVVAKKYFKFTHAALEQEGDQVYLVLSADNFLYTEEELKTIHYFEKDGEAEKEGMTLPVAKVEGTNGLIKLYFNFTNEDPNGKWWWGHWSIKGEIKGDVNTTIEAKEITLGGKKYSLWAQGEWNQVVVKVEKLAGSVRSLYGAYYPDADTFYLWFEVENFTMDDLNKVELLINGNGTEKTPANIIKSSAPILQCQLQFNNMKSVLSDGENILSFKLDGQVYKTLGVNESVSGSHKVDGKVYTISKNENNEVVITVTNDTTDPDEPADKAITNVYNFEFSGIDTIFVWFQTTGYEMDDLDAMELYVNGVGTGIKGDSYQTADAGQYHVVFHGVKSALKDDRNVITFNFNGQNYTLPDGQNILGVTTYTEDGKVYTITKENNEIVVTVTDEGTSGGGDQPGGVRDVQLTNTDFYSTGYVKLFMNTDDLKYIDDNASYVEINGERSTAWDGKGYLVDGEVCIQVNYPSEADKYEFKWYNAEGVLVAQAVYEKSGTTDPVAPGTGGDTPTEAPTVNGAYVSNVYNNNENMTVILPGSDPASSLYQTVAEKMAYVKVNGEKKNDLKDMFAYGAAGDYAINVWLGGPVEIGANYSFEICDAEGNVLLKIEAVQYNG